MESGGREQEDDMERAPVDPTNNLAIPLLPGHKNLPSALQPDGTR